MQGLRGRLQAVEPAPCRRLRADGRLLRQHEAALWHHLAPRRVHREPEEAASDRRCGPRGARRGRDGAAARRGRARRPGTLGFYERRVQALRRGALPAGLPDRLHHPQRVRQRLHPTRHLQRLRLLRPSLSLRRHNPGPHTTAAPSSAPSATTASATASSRPAPRPARPTPSCSARSRN